MLDQKAEAYLKSCEQEALELLIRLAQIPAPSNREEKRAVFCREWLEENGAQGVYVDQALNVIYPVYSKDQESAKQPLTVYAAHTDVVFPDLAPLPLTVEGNQICCPGVGDDTACLTALLIAARYVARGLRQGTLKPKDGGVLLVCNSGEEGLGNLKGSREICRAFGEQMREFITLDGQLDRLAVRAVGSKRYQVEIRTQGGHSYGDFGRPNAIARMAALIARLYEIPVPEGAKTTFNVGMISGGTSVNTIAQQAQMLYEFRSESRENLQYMEDHFMELIRQARAREDMELSLTLVGERPCGGDVDEQAQEQLLNRVRQRVRELIGRDPKESAGSTDCNIPLSLGIPSVCAGAYYGGGAHTREEFVEADSLKDGCKLALSLILDHFEVQD